MVCRRISDPPSRHASGTQGTHVHVRICSAKDTAGGIASKYEGDSSAARLLGSALLPDWDWFPACFGIRAGRKSGRHRYPDDASLHPGNLQRPEFDARTIGSARLADTG